jgi:hypothetical protein
MRVLMVIAAAVLAAHPVSPRTGDSRLLAWPRLVSFKGGPLHREVLISERTDIQRLMDGLAQPAPATPDTVGRDFVWVALYWQVPVAPEWLRARQAPHDVADQTAQFFPARGKAPALWVYRAGWASPASVRLMTPDALALLTSHGIPTGRGRASG